MKKRCATAIVIVFLCLTLLCSCSNLEIASVDELMRPPRQTGENALIEQAFEKSVGESYSLTSPLGGLYRSSYVMYDINGDSYDESVVFYTPSSKGAVHMNVIRSDGENWESVCDIEGAGTQVNRVEFADIDGDSLCEIIVGWSLYEGLSGQYMCVYTSSGAGSLELKQISNVPYETFEIMDIDNDGCDDLLLLCSVSDGDSGTRRCARYVDLRDGELSVVGETTLDKSIVSYISVVSDVSAGTKQRRIYIDAAREDGLWLTQCLIWDSKKLVFDSPLSDSVSGSENVTLRDVLLLSEDIDSDGQIEIPTVGVLEGSSVIRDNSVSAGDNVRLVIRLRLLGASGVEASRCIYNQDDGYMLTILTEWDGVTAVSDRDNNTLKVYPYENGTSLSKGTKELFTIKTVEDGQQSIYKSYYDVLSIGNGKCRMYKISAQGEAKGITKEQLIKVIEGI